MYFSVALGLNRKVDEYLKFHWRVFLSKLQVAPLPAELKFMYMPDTRRVFFSACHISCTLMGPGLNAGTHGHKSRTQKKKLKRETHRKSKKKRKDGGDLGNLCRVKCQWRGSAGRWGVALLARRWRSEMEVGERSWSAGVC